jgi:hypothetical protein
MLASWSVAKSAIEAPTGPDGVRPFVGAVDGTATSCSKTSDKTMPGQCMPRIIQNATQVHQLAIGTMNRLMEWKHFRLDGRAFS